MTAKKDNAAEVLKILDRINALLASGELDGRVLFNFIGDIRELITSDSGIVQEDERIKLLKKTIKPLLDQIKEIEFLVEEIKPPYKILKDTTRTIKLDSQDKEESLQKMHACLIQIEEIAREHGFSEDLKENIDNSKIYIKDLYKNITGSELPPPDQATETITSNRGTSNPESGTRGNEKPLPNARDVRTIKMNHEMKEEMFQIISPVEKELNGRSQIDTNCYLGRNIRLILNGFNEIKMYGDDQILKEEVVKAKLIKMMALADSMRGIVAIKSLEPKDDYGQFIDRVRLGINKIYKLLMLENIPTPRKDRSIISKLAEFMKGVFDEYETNPDTSPNNLRRVYEKFTEMFKDLYSNNNKGQNESIETKKVYSDAFEEIITNNDESQKKIVMTNYFKPLLNGWVNQVLQSFFRSKDSDKQLEKNIDELILKIFREFDKLKGNWPDFKFIERVRTSFETEYRDLKNKCLEGGVTLEEFENMFISSFTFNLDFRRRLMQGSLGIDCIEI